MKSLPPSRDHYTGRLLDCIDRLEECTVRPMDVLPRVPDLPYHDAGTQTQTGGNNCSPQGGRTAGHFSHSNAVSPHGTASAGGGAHSLPATAQLDSGITPSFPAADVRDQQRRKFADGLSWLVTFWAAVAIVMTPIVFTLKHLGVL